MSVAASDDLFSLGYVVDGLPLLDSSFTDTDSLGVVVDALPLLAPGLGDEDVEYDGTVILSVVENVEFNGSTILQVQEDFLGDFQTNLHVLANNLVAVTSASSASNPLTPTLILNGNVIYSNPATLPASGYSAAACYISLACENLINNISAEDTISWSIDINNQGGTWRTVTTTDLGNYGSDVTLFGLNGTVTKKGFNYSNGSGGYINAGILGPRNFNREMMFLLTGNAEYFNQAVSQYLGTPEGAILKVHADAANLIGNLAGVGVQWALQDFPLNNFQPQATQTAGEALSSLAQEVGGTLRWNGDTSYVATLPDRSFGLWEVPDCCLITALQKECNLDLNTGYYNPGVYCLSTLNQYDAGTLTVPQSQPAPGAGGESPYQLEVPYTIMKPITTTSPKLTLDLPFDFDEVFIQNVTKTDSTGPYVTFDPNKFFLLQSGFGQYINYHDVGGVLKPVLNLDSNLFPLSNTDLAAENWYMRIGYTRKALPQTNQSKVSTTNTIGRTILRYKFIPACTGSISAAFFGSIPLPGMTARATLGGKTVEGIIESVNFSSPGVITVNVVQWIRLEYYQQLAKYDNLPIL